MKHLLLITAICALPFGATAQDFGLSGPAEIITEDLGAAQDFDPGVIGITTGGLDAGLWQGTSAARAAKLVTDAPLTSSDPIIRDMVRTVVLSGGVPPQAQTGEAGAAYERARLQAVLALGEGETTDGFLARNPELAQSPLAQVDLALTKGEIKRACEISDTITADRGLPQWARLRAACHAVRGEMSAAELTRDLLRGGGYDNPSYYAQLNARIAGAAPAAQTDPNDPLVSFLAKRETAIAGGAGLDADLAALFASWNTADLTTIQQRLGNLSFNVAAGDLDLETALSTPSARATARLFVLGQSGDAAALDAFMNRANRAGVNETDLVSKLSPMIQTLPAQARVNTNLTRFAKAAVQAGDMGSLQGLYAALPDGPQQQRIALAADALGGGFNAQGLGRDIDGRLSSPTTREAALGDAVMAIALGATMSDAAAEALNTASLPRPTLPEGQLILLDAAARANSRAETTLLAAKLLSRSGLNASDHAHIVGALNRAGLTQFSGPIAAREFLASLG